MYAQDTLNLFYADLGTEQVATASMRTLVFDRHFGNSGNGLWISRHLNGAQKLLPARNFVDRFRDSSETDTIGKVAVSPATLTNTFTNSGIIHIPANDLLDELTLVHEYGHFVQESIGAYFPIAAFHTTCTVSDPGYACFEGFPEFLANAVMLLNATDFAMPPAAVALSDIAPSSGCVLASPDSVEGVVTDILFHLLNDGDRTCRDPLCTRKLWDGRASLIFSIFDKEFDYSAPGDKNLKRFREAWIARGGAKSYMVGYTQNSDVEKICEEIFRWMKLLKNISPHHPDAMLVTRTFTR